MSIIPTRSVEEALRSAHLWKRFDRSVVIRNAAASTAGTTASGSMSGRRMDATVTLPAMTGPTGAYCMRASVGSLPGQALALVAVETELGSLAVATDTFTAGSAMRSRRDRVGASVQADAQLVALVATVALTATTPTITITYTNQDGVGSRTATVLLPTSIAVNTAFLLRPDQLQAGDTAIRSVENISKSAGTAGTLKLFGLNPIGVEAQSGLLIGANDSIQVPKECVEVYAGENIGFYAMGLTSATLFQASMHFLGAS